MTLRQGFEVVAPKGWWPEDQSCAELADRACPAQTPRDSSADALFRASGEEREENTNLSGFGQTRRLKGIKQHPELRHREAMARRQRSAVGLVVSERDGHQMSALFCDLD